MPSSDVTLITDAPSVRARRRAARMAFERLLAVRRGVLLSEQTLEKWWPGTSLGKEA